MITFTIRPDGGKPYPLTATSRDVFVYEKTNKGKSFASIMNDLHMSDMYGLAHLAARRQQLFAGTLAEFAESCDLDMEDDDEADPTQPEASPEP